MIARRRRRATFGARQQRSGGGLMRWLATLLVTVGVAWAAGLVWFVGHIPAPAPAPDARTDAIVVLTGGSGRLEAGLDLLQDGWARTLFVSGVYATVDVRLLLDVFKRQLPELACCVELGYAANNTRGNAAETQSWVQHNTVTSLRLVTSTYHMPRALLEFRRSLGDVTLIAHPVAPQTHDLRRWWQCPRTFRLVAWEYTKYLLARLRLQFETGPG